MDKPHAYKVSKKEESLFWAVIDIDIFRLKFRELERFGKLELEYKARMDGKDLNDPSDLSVPDHLYTAAKEQAYAIRKDQRKKAQ